MRLITLSFTLLLMGLSSCQEFKRNEIPIVPIDMLENQEIENRDDCTCSIPPPGTWVLWNGTGTNSLYEYLTTDGNDCLLDECNDCWGQTSQTALLCAIGDNSSNSYDLLKDFINNTKRRDILCILEDLIEDNRPSSQYKVKEISYTLYDVSCNEGFTPMCYEDDPDCGSLPLPFTWPRREVSIQVTYALCSSKAC